MARKIEMLPKSFLLQSVILPLAVLGSDPVNQFQPQKGDPPSREAVFRVDEDTTAVLAEDRGKVLTKAEDGLVWVDGETLPIEGKPFEDADTYFARLPPYAKSGVVKGTWMMGHCTPGMSYVFRTDAPKLRLRWSLTLERLSMSHMPATGVSGLDLYLLGDDGKWSFRKCCIPRKQYDNEVEVEVEPGRTYRLYLPLFNGISKIAFGVEKGRTLEPVPLAPEKKPIVFYGGSVTQGACVTRPGNLFVNIAGRKLGWPTVCMGFNGQGCMTIFEAELLAKIDAEAYCFLCFGNMDASTMKATCLAFLRRLHELRPNVPIVLGAYHYILATGPKYAVEHAVAAEVVHELMTEDPKSWSKLTVVPIDKLCPADCDGSVDGGHPNDYGAQFMADGFVEALTLIGAF